MEAEFLLGDGNQPLLFRKWPVDPGSRPARQRRAVFLGHSQPTHSGMLGELGQAFRRLGWDAYSGDVRGHGRSTSPGLPLGHLPLEEGWACAVDDMRRFLEAAFDGVAWENRLVVVPNITALMVLELLKTWPDLARHIVLISPPPNQRALALFGKTFSKVRLKLGAADRPDEQSLHHLYAFLGAHLKGRRHPADVMSPERAVIEAVLDDPLGWPIPTPAYWYNIFSGMLSAWKWPKDTQVKPGTRCLILYGGEDAMTRDGGFLPPIDRFMERAGMDDIASARVQGGRSALFLEETRLGIADRISRWIGEDWEPEEDPAEISVADITHELLAVTSGRPGPREMSPGELVELCYNAIDDETNWTEIIYRMIYETDRTGEMAEEALAEDELHRRISHLMPHWERSFSLNKQVMMNATLGVLLQSVIERLQVGVALLDREGALLHGNAIYTETLTRLFAGTGGTGGAGAGANDTLAERLTRRLLAGERTPAVSPGTAGETIVLHEDRPVGVRFFPEALRQANLQPQGPASVLVLRAPDAPEIGEDSRVALTELAYGLTRKEAEIVLLIAGGNTPDEAAARLGILVSTVRGHLKKAFSKMEVHSQSELAATVLSGPIGWLA